MAVRIRLGAQMFGNFMGWTTRLQVQMRFCARGALAFGEESVWGHQNKKPAAQGTQRVLVIKQMFSALEKLMFQVRIRNLSQKEE